MDNITAEEWTIIRKALQIILRAHLCIETYDGIEYRDTKLDALIRKIRALEEGLTSPKDSGSI